MSQISGLGILRCGGCVGDSGFDSALQLNQGDGVPTIVDQRYGYVYMKACALNVSSCRVGFRMQESGTHAGFGDLLLELVYMLT